MSRAPITCPKMDIIRNRPIYCQGVPVIILKNAKNGIGMWMQANHCQENFLVKLRK